MVSNEVYHSMPFINIIKLMMLLVNVYFFFIKMNALPQCLLNLYKTFSPQCSPRSVRNLSLKDQERVIWLISICYFGGCNFVPGGHH